MSQNTTTGNSSLLGDVGDAVRNIYHDDKRDFLRNQQFPLV